MEDGDSVVLDISPTDTEEKSTRANHVYQQIRIFSNACDKKNIPQIKKLLTSYATSQNNGIPKLLNNTFENPETKNIFRNRVIDALLNEAYTEFQHDNSELLFFASAKFEVERLKEVIKEFKEDSDSYSQNINQTRYSDSVILFALKYGNVENENFQECMTILTEAGVDINRYDVKGKFAIDYIALLYDHFKNKDKVETNITTALRNVAQLLLDKGIHSSDNIKTTNFLTDVMHVNIKEYPFVTMNEQAKLFYWIVKNKTEDFLSTRKAIIQTYKNIDSEENTLLQLASKKTDNMLPIVQFLLKNGADPNQVTKWNNLTPLELSAMNNNQKIFEEILKYKKTEITQKQYNNFVRCRSQPMKVKLFEILLESDKLNPNFTYDKTGNTPLHYAIIFSHKKAIQNLLKRHSSLIIKNKFGKCALDMITAEDLEKYFDSCLALDNYTPYFSDVNYKMRFRFNCLIDNRMSREVKVVSKIGKRPNLEHLLTHPFIHTFITLKWFKVKFYFWIILIFQAVTFILLSVLFYRLDDPDATSIEYYFCILVAFINIAMKTPIFLNVKIKNRRIVWYTLNRASLHCCTEIFLMITMIGSFFQKQFRAFLFVEMAISFLLTTGYHPRLSKWSLMLQQVFKTFSILLLFFSLLVVGFGAGFRISFPEDDLFANFSTSVFRTYIMTTGEFDATDADFDTSGFVGYLLFLLFAMSMSLVIVNFWTGVAVTDIERIEKNSEINASKNVCIFMLFIDYLYAFKYLRKIRKYVTSPLLFLRINEAGRIYHHPEKCEINFFVNKEKQFEETNVFPVKVDDDCFNKIRCHYYKLARVTTDQEVLKKLDELTKMVTELKTKFMKNDNVTSDNKTKKDFRNKRGNK